MCVFSDCNSFEKATHMERKQSLKSLIRKYNSNELPPPNFKIRAMSLCIRLLLWIKQLMNFPHGDLEQKPRSSHSPSWHGKLLGWHFPPDSGFPSELLGESTVIPTLQGKKAGKQSSQPQPSECIFQWNDALCIMVPVSIIQAG